MVKERIIFSCNRIALILGCLWLTACGGGGGPTTPPPPPVDTLLTIRGSVDDNQGAPIAGVQVLLGLAKETTNSMGEFSFNNLRAGNYLVSIQDSDGNFDSRTLALSSQNTEFSFTLPPVQSGFRVTKVFPSLNSTSAPLLGQIVIETTTEPNLATLTSSNLLITPDIGEFSIRYDAPELIIQPRLQQPPNQQVVVELTRGVRDVSGTSLGHSARWLFKTSPSDFSPPVLINQSPNSGDSTHPPNLGITFEFNEPIFITGNEFRANSTGDIELIPRALGRVLVLDSVSGWEPLTSYVVTVSGVADQAGNLTSGTYRLPFTTGEQPAFSVNLDPEWNSVTDEIVFASNRNGSFDIFSIHPDGTGLIQLTNLPGDELNPSLSYSGTILTFQHRSTGSKWDIYTQAIDSQDPVIVTTSTSNNYDPHFSRTASETIVFTSDRITPPGLFKVHYQGDTPLELDLDFNSRATQPALHPLLDTQMLFVSSRGGSNDIWRKTISAIDGESINLNLTGDFLSHEHSPAWSPDAGSVVYISNEGGHDNLWITDASGAFPRQVTLFEEQVGDPSHSPHPGEQVAVVVVYLPEGGTDLVLVDLVGGEITSNLTNPGAVNE